MKKAIYIVICLFTITLTSCKKDTQSLQQYIIESREKPNFESFDISSSMIDGYLTMANTEMRETAKSIRKISLLGMKASGNEVAYEAEKAKLDKILENSEQYKSLIKVKKMGVKLNLYYKGTPENISEVIVFGYAQDKGVGLARLTGEKIKTDKLISLIKNSKIPSGVFEGMDK